MNETVSGNDISMPIVPWSSSLWCLHITSCNPWMTPSPPGCSSHKPTAHQGEECPARGHERCSRRTRARPENQSPGAQATSVLTSCAVFQVPLLVNVLLWRGDSGTRSLPEFLSSSKRPKTRPFPLWKDIVFGETFSQAPRAEMWWMESLVFC